MIVHSFHTHKRDAWCIEFHLNAYLSFCNQIVCVVDGDSEFAESLKRPRVQVIDFPADPSLPEVNDRGIFYRAKPIRQTALNHAMRFDPSLIVFGDTDEVPTPEAFGWIPEMAKRPQAGERWYCHWVNLWRDFDHAIGGMSEWSFQNPRGNKKCLMMQPGGDMVYADEQHNGMEPGRQSGGPAPTGEGKYLIDWPKLMHMKYGWSGFPNRAEAKLPRHQPGVMLRGGEAVNVPPEWKWPGMDAIR